MATYTGKDGVMEVGGTVVGEMRSFSIDAQADTLDDTVMGDDWKTHKAMHKSWSGEAMVLHDPADAGQVACAIGDSIAGEWFPSGEDAGATALSGTATITGRRVNTSYDGLEELNITFEGNGALTETTVSV